MNRPRLQWSPDWKSVLFTACLLPVLVSLGFWQLQRAEVKRAEQARYEAGLAAAPLSLAELGDDPANYRPVAISGRFDPRRYFLLDNRTRNGEAGFEVIGLLQESGSQRLVAVNRGWVAGGADRRHLPVVTFPDGEIRVTGNLYRPEVRHWMVPPPPSASGDWPRLSASMTVADLQSSLGEPLYPHLVRLAADSPAALVTDWQPINTQPEKSTGYAVQWFLMAFALLVLFVLRNSNLRDWIRGRDTSQASLTEQAPPGHDNEP